SPCAVAGSPYGEGSAGDAGTIRHHTSLAAGWSGDWTERLRRVERGGSATLGLGLSRVVAGRCRAGGGRVGSLGGRTRLVRGASSQRATRAAHVAATRRVDCGCAADARYLSGDRSPHSSGR